MLAAEGSAKGSSGIGTAFRETPNEAKWRGLVPYTDWGLPPGRGGILDMVAPFTKIIRQTEPGHEL